MKDSVSYPGSLTYKGYLINRETRCEIRRGSEHVCYAGNLADARATVDMLAGLDKAKGQK